MNHLIAGILILVALCLLFTQNIGVGVIVAMISIATYKPDTLRKE